MEEASPKILEQNFMINERRLQFLPTNQILKGKRNRLLRRLAKEYMKINRSEIVRTKLIK